MSKLTHAEVRGYRRAANVEFDPVILPPIDGKSRFVARHLDMANLAIEWLAKSQPELRAHIERLVVEDRVSPELSEALTEAEQWFRATANLMQAALARSLVVTSASLVEELST